MSNVARNIPCFLPLALLAKKFLILWLTDFLDDLGWQ